jgi:hypothetical protein
MLLEPIEVIGLLIAIVTGVSGLAISGILLLKELGFLSSQNYH